MGIKDLKELVVFMAVMGNAVDQATKDGFQAADIGLVVPAFMKAPEAFAGIENVPAEFKDLDDAEKDEIVKAVKENLDLADDVLEGIVEDAFAMVLGIVSLAGKIKAARA